MPPSQRVGALEVLRVAFMRGDLNDVRNQMARALAWKTHSSEALESLLSGLEGIGIDLSGARTALGGVPSLNLRDEQRDGCWAGEGVGAVPERGLSVDARDVASEVCVRGKGWEIPRAVVQDKDTVMSRVDCDHVESRGHNAKENISVAVQRNFRENPDRKRPRRRRSGGKGSSRRM